MQDFKERLFRSFRKKTLSILSPPAVIQIHSNIKSICSDCKGDDVGAKNLYSFLIADVSIYRRD